MFFSTLLILLFVSPLAIAQDNKARIYIPKDLEDCFHTLDSILSDSVKSEIMWMSESEFRGRAHFGIGMWMRNNWGLWSGESRLSHYFSRLGLWHPDDMSGVILTSYYRYLWGEPIKLRQQIRYYKQYWKENGGCIKVPKIKGGNYKTLEENAAFLNLPRIDSVTGALMTIRHNGDTLSKQDSAYLLRHTVLPAGLPQNPYSYNGDVKSVLYVGKRKDSDTHDTIYEEYDRYHRLTKYYSKFGSNSNLECYTNHYDSLGRISWKFTHRLVYDYKDTIYDTMDVYHYIYNDHGYSIYSAPYYDGHCLLLEISDSEIVSEPSCNFTEENVVILDEQGHIISELDKLNNHICYQYDSIGRLVAKYRYEQKDDSTTLIFNWQTIIYNSKDNTKFILSAESDNILCQYKDRREQYTRECYQDARRHIHHPKYMRIRTDKNGNTTRIKYKNGKTIEVFYNYY